MPDIEPEGKPKGKPDYEVVKGADFSDGFSPEAIAKAAEAEILPQLKLKELVTEDTTITVQLDGEPRLIKSTKLPKGQAWFTDAIYNDQRMSMVLPRSLQFSLLALQKRNEWDTFDGQMVVISAARGKIKTGTFEGEAKTYKASLPA